MTDLELLVKFAGYVRSNLGGKVQLTKQKGLYIESYITPEQLVQLWNWLAVIVCKEALKK